METPEILFERKKVGKFILINEHTADCSLLKWHPKGRKLLTSSYDGTSKLFKLDFPILNNKSPKSIMTLSYL